MKKIVVTILIGITFLSCGPRRLRCGPNRRCETKSKEINQYEKDNIYTADYSVA